MISDLFMGLMKLTITGLFIWGLCGHADQLIELDRAVVEEERRLQGLGWMRQDMVERLRLAEGLVLQAETILASRSAG